MHTNQAPMPHPPAGPSLTYLGAQQYRLSMELRFDPGWICGLSHGLAERQISITRVEAARGSGRMWHARLDLDFSATATAAADVDYAALCRLPATVQALVEPVVLDDYQLERSTRAAGSLYVEVSGPDRLGVLSSVLNTFSLFSLFPSELLAETRHKRIFDRFWLKGMANRVPSDEAVAALRERLREFTC